MAVSAFKSTTKRVCVIGGSSEPDNAHSILPVPPSPASSKRGHRRTASFSDFHFKDANSIQLDSLFQQGRVSARYQSDVDDSGSDADSVYSRHTNRSLQTPEIGSVRKFGVLTRKPRVDKRRSPSVERCYKEVAEFLSLIDDPADANAGDPNHSPGNDSLVEGTPESAISRPARPRLTVDVPSETESAYSHRSRILEAQSDTEQGNPRFPRLRRGFDAQSDSESVFLRLSRPRQATGAGPPRTGANQNGKAKGTRAGSLRRSTSQLDNSGSDAYRIWNDQSDSESILSRNNNGNRRQAANFGQSNTVAAAATRKKGTRQASLRRSSSNIEFSNIGLEGFRLPSCAHEDEGFRQPSRVRNEPNEPRREEAPEEVVFEIDHECVRLDRGSPGDHPEEEKTIRAIHSHRGQELDAVALYDAMRAEMRKAVSEIRSELEQSVSKDVVLASPILDEGVFKEDEIEASVSEVRREYAAKLELSEKRAQDLWTQLAAEERRCLDLVMYVKDLILPQTGPSPKPRVTPPPELRPVTGLGTEQQLVSQCLDADAQRYFDECISLAGLDVISVNDASSCGIGGYQESECGWSVKDVTFSPRKKSIGLDEEKNMAALQPLISFCAQIEQNGKCIGKASNLPAVNDDGLLLPWLQWETNLDYSFQEQTGGKGTLTASCSRSRAVSKNQPATWLESRHQSKDEEEQPLDLLPGVSGLGCFSNGDLSTWDNMTFGHLSNAGMSSTIFRGRGGDGVDVEMFVLQRSLLRHRIREGRILICGGIRF